MVDGGKGVPSAPAPETPIPAPMAAPAPSVEPAALASSGAPVEDRQLSLLDWKPRPRVPVQYSLFGEPEEIK